MNWLCMPAAAVLLVVGFTEAGHAGVIPDPQQPAFNATTGFLNGAQELAQTFTVGTSGNLQGITITIAAGSPNDIALRLISTVGGVPGASIFGTAVATPAASFPPYTTTYYDFSTAGLYLGAGEVFAFLLSATTSTGQVVAVEVRDDGTDPYSGGELFTRGSSTPFEEWAPFADTITGAMAADMRFTVLMEVPVPASLALLAVALPLLRARRRRPNSDENF